MKILRACVTPDRQVKAIEVMYTDTKAKVLSPDAQTELFDIFAGKLFVCTKETCRSSWREYDISLSSQWQ